MNPLALVAADTNHLDTAGFILSVPSAYAPAAAHVPRARGSFL
jgi:hypothetical protein